MLFVRYKFRHVEHNNTTPCIQFSNLSLVRVRHLLTTQQNCAVSNLYSTNCSGAPSVVSNPYFTLVHLVVFPFRDTHVRYYREISYDPEYSIPRSYVFHAFPQGPPRLGHYFVRVQAYLRYVIEKGTQRREGEGRDEQRHETVLQNYN